MKTIYDLCVPRADVVKGRIRDEEFAADLASVADESVGKAEYRDYADPVQFFKYTHPTRGLRSLLETVCRRLSGVGGEVNSVIRLDTQFGGGKTHSLIAVVHAVRGMKGVKNPGEFVDPSLLPKSAVRVAALDGQNSDPANGLELEPGLKAFTLWGEMAYRLAGRKGYERVRRSDEAHTAPGSTVITELLGGHPLHSADAGPCGVIHHANLYPGVHPQAQGDSLPDPPGAVGKTAGRCALSAGRSCS